MNIYEELGVKTCINAAGTYTVVGGSSMTKETTDAMAQAAEQYVKLEDLQKAINDRVAEMTRNEAAFLCNSCSTALILAAGACVSRRYGKPMHYLTREQVNECNVVAFWSQHIPYDYAIRQTGVQMRFVGYPNPEAALAERELRMNIDENTVCVYFASRTPMGYLGPDCMNLETVIRVAHDMGVPVLVDAAAQLPPKANLWNYTQMGADFAAFSGGKDLCGPQASGLLVGKKEYMDWVAELGFPKYSIGRIMKIGREEMVGLYTAIKAYVNGDEAARLQKCEDEVKLLHDMLSPCPWYTVERCWPNQAGQSLPRAFVRLTDRAEKNPGELRDALMAGEPAVYCLSENKNGVYINPMCLKDGEMAAIARRLVEIAEGR